MEQNHTSDMADCFYCDGYGFNTTPAYQQGGEIIEEDRRVCSMCEGTGLRCKN